MKNSDRALEGRVSFLLHGVDVHAFAGDDAGLVVGAEASGGEVAGDLDRPQPAASRTEPLLCLLPFCPAFLHHSQRYASESHGGHIRIERQKVPTHSARA